MRPVQHIMAQGFHYYSERVKKEPGEEILDRSKTKNQVSCVLDATGLGQLVEVGCGKFDCAHPKPLGRHGAVRRLRTMLWGWESAVWDPRGLLELARVLPTQRPGQQILTLGHH